jgi:hypothetical protein
MTCSFIGFHFFLTAKTLPSSASPNRRCCVSLDPSVWDSYNTTTPTTVYAQRFIPNKYVDCHWQDLSSVAQYRTWATNSAFHRSQRGAHCIRREWPLLTLSVSIVLPRESSICEEKTTINRSAQVIWEIATNVCKSLENPSFSDRLTTPLSASNTQPTRPKPQLRASHLLASMWPLAMYLVRWRSGMQWRE